MFSLRSLLLLLTPILVGLLTILSLLPSQLYQSPSYAPSITNKPSIEIYYNSNHRFLPIRHCSWGISLQLGCFHALIYSFYWIDMINLSKRFFFFIPVLSIDWFYILILCRSVWLLCTKLVAFLFCSFLLDWHLHLSCLYLYVLAAVFFSLLQAQVIFDELQKLIHKFSCFLYFLRWTNL